MSEIAQSLVLTAKEINDTVSKLQGRQYWWESPEMSTAAHFFTQRLSDSKVRLYEVNTSLSGGAERGGYDAIKKAAETDGAIHIRLINTGNADAKEIGGSHWKVEVQKDENIETINPFTVGQNDGSTCGPWALKIANLMTDKLRSEGTENVNLQELIRSVRTTISQCGLTDANVREEMAKVYKNSAEKISRIHNQPRDVHAPREAEAAAPNKGQVATTAPDNNAALKQARRVAAPARDVINGKGKPVTDDRAMELKGQARSLGEAAKAAAEPGATEEDKNNYKELTGKVAFASVEEALLFGAGLAEWMNEHSTGDLRALVKFFEAFAKAVETLGVAVGFDTTKDGGFVPNSAKVNEEKTKEKFQNKEPGTTFDPDAIDSNITTQNTEVEQGGGLSI